jgi:hypothetical protein
MANRTLAVNILKSRISLSYYSSLCHLIDFYIYPYFYFSLSFGYGLWGHGIVFKKKYSYRIIWRKKGSAGNKLHKIITEQ